MTDKQNDRLFSNLDADEAENSVTVIQSACLNCHAQGETRLLLTRIPFFKDIILASFSCPSCGFANRSVDTAGMIEDQGVRFELRVRPLSKCFLKMVSRFPVFPYLLLVFSVLWNQQTLREICVSCGCESLFTTIYFTRAKTVFKLVFSVDILFLRFLLGAQWKRLVAADRCYWSIRDAPSRTWQFISDLTRQ